MGLLFVLALPNIQSGLLRARAGEATTTVNAKDRLTYVSIRPGEFQMGCSGSDCAEAEKPQHRVRITKGFWIGQTEVTQAAYEKVMKVPNPAYFKGADLPVETVSWYDADKYCKTVGMRLPTEAEWEYAARVGNTSELYGEIGQIAVYSGNSNSRTAKVRSKWPNAWGLYDMLGNVWEWTNDWYADHYYKTSTADDPPGPKEGSLKVLRGGSWGNSPVSVRVSVRGGLVPTDRAYSIGFRCAGELR
jgi:formylglycine-generating enzyme required for sulfatase activity